MALSVFSRRTPLKTACILPGPSASLGVMGQVGQTAGGGKVSLNYWTHTLHSGLRFHWSWASKGTSISIGTVARSLLDFSYSVYLFILKTHTHRYTDVSSLGDQGQLIPLKLELRVTGGGQFLGPLITWVLGTYSGPLEEQPILLRAELDPHHQV